MKPSAWAPVRPCAEGVTPSVGAPVAPRGLKPSTLGRRASEASPRTGHWLKMQNTYTAGGLTPQNIPKGPKQVARSGDASATPRLSAEGFSPRMGDRSPPTRASPPRHMGERAPMPRASSPAYPKGPKNGSKLPKMAPISGSRRHLGPRDPPILTPRPILPQL